MRRGMKALREIKIPNYYWLTNQEAPISKSGLGDHSKPHNGLEIPEHGHQGPPGSRRGIPGGIVRASQSVCNSCKEGNSNVQRYPTATKYHGDI